MTPTCPTRHATGILLRSVLLLGAALWGIGIAPAIDDAPTSTPRQEQPSSTGNDLLLEAVSGRLWGQNVQELARGVLSRAQVRLVDNATARIRRDKNVGFGKMLTGDIEMRVSMENVRPLQLSTTVYNKGDNGELDKDSFEQLLRASIERLTYLLNVEPQQRKTSKRETGLRLRAWEWEGAHCAAVLEASSIGSGKKYSAEFIRLSIARNKDELERGSAADAVRRADLRDHVKKLSDGTTVCLESVPMVDQGEKGYCVPASLSRVFAYYGMDGVDQHALAALCRSTGDSGTTLQGMEKALRSISGAFHVNVINWEWLSEKALQREVARLIKKEHIPPQNITPGILEKYIESRPSVISKGFKEIKKHIDAGIPIVWAVMLGVFPENGLPQAAGGHMRLIIGYNEEKQFIVYSDSWGAGHEMKAMSAARACIITRALYVLRPMR